MEEAEYLPGQVCCVQHLPTSQPSFYVKYQKDEVGKNAEARTADCLLCRHKLICLVRPRMNWLTYSPVAQR